MRYYTWFPAVLVIFCTAGSFAQQSDINGTGSVNFPFQKPLSISELNIALGNLTKDTSAAAGLFFEQFSSRLDSINIDIGNDEFIDKYLLTAEVYFSASYYLPEERAILYRAMSDLMFSRLVDSLNHAAGAGRDIGHDQSEYLRRSLSKNGYLFDVKTSNASKLWHYISEGRFEYVFRKLTTTYLKEFLFAVSAGIVFFTLIFLLFRRNRKK